MVQMAPDPRDGQIALDGMVLMPRNPRRERLVNALLELGRSLELAVVLPRGEYSAETHPDVPEATRTLARALIRSQDLTLAPDDLAEADKIRALLARKPKPGVPPRPKGAVKQCRFYLTDDSRVLRIGGSVSDPPVDGLWIMDLETFEFVCAGHGIALLAGEGR